MSTKAVRTRAGSFSLLDRQFGHFTRAVYEAIRGHIHPVQDGLQHIGHGYARSAPQVLAVREAQLAPSGEHQGVVGVDVGLAVA